MRRLAVGSFLLLLLLSRPGVSQEGTFDLAPAAEEPCVYFGADSCPGQKWRLWIPEVFIIDRDSDRHFTDIGPVEWRREGKRLWYEKDMREAPEYALWLRMVASPEGDGIRLLLTVRNEGTKPWGKLAHPAVCLSSQEAPDFHDSTGASTYVRAGTAWQSLDRLLGDNIREQYNHFWVEPLADPKDQGARMPVESGTVIRENTDRSRCLVFTWDKVARVDVNFNQFHCIHSHPLVGALGPGEEKALEGRVRIVSGPAHALRIE